MDLVRLPVGAQANVDTDCIRIEEQADGVWKLTGTALCDGTEDGTSASIVGGPTFGSYKEAETAGIDWAADIGVAELMISHGTLQHPLETLEIDLPL